jgi:uncharacterized integral membrane protein
MEGSPTPSPPPRQPPPAEKRDIPWGLILFAVVAVYALLLLLLNREEVPISFVFFSVQISKLVLILLCLGLGFAAGFLLDRWRARRRDASVE